MNEAKCPICSANTQKLFEVQDRFKTTNQIFSLRKCLDCKTVFTFPSPNQEEIKKFYPRVYSWKKEYKTGGLLSGFLRKLEEKYVYHLLEHDTKSLLKNVKQLGKILDVGCGTGTRLEVFRKTGLKDCYGIEPSDEAVYAKNIKKLPVEQKSLTNLTSLGDSFDIITLYHVFEHLDNPASHLKVIKKNLNLGGYLVIQVPNFGSFQAKIFGKKWFALDVPRHYFHYTPETIARLLSQNGFEAKKIDQNTNFLHPVYWVISLFPFLDPQLTWKDEEKGKNRIAHKILWILLTLFSILPAKIENLLGKGGNMTIYAVKKD